jgi:hypothetical protein
MTTGTTLCNRFPTEADPSNPASQANTLKDAIMSNMASGRRGFAAKQSYSWLHQVCVGGGHMAAYIGEALGP